MSTFNSFVNAVFGAVWVPFRGLNPWVGLTVLSAIVGVLALVAMKYCSNQTRIAELKDRYKAHVLAIKLFRDDLRVVFSSLGKTLGLISFYMGHQLRPMVVMLVPIVFLFAQMQMRLAYEPLPMGKKVYVDVELSKSAPGVDTVQVDLPPGLEMAGALVRVPSRHLVKFPIRGTTPGMHEITLRCGSETVTKSVHIGPEKELAMLSPVRSSSTEDLVLYPTEPSFGKDSAFARVSLPYSIRELPLLGLDWSFGFELGMGITFMIISIVVALLLKGAFGVTI